MVILVNNKSIWNKDNSLLNLKNNEFDNETDILIIGGGITGLTLAYFLKDTNDKVMLIDKSKIASGITSKTTAKINYLQGIIYQTLIKKFSFNVAKLYYDSQIDAINIIKSIIKENNISCNLEQVDSIIFTLENKGVSKIYEEKKILESFNSNVGVVNNEKIKIGIKVNDTYVFNPLQYLNGIFNNLKNKINIYENVVAREIAKNKSEFVVKTNKGNIIAKKVIVACHYPFFIFPNLIPLKTYVKREYVNAAKTNNPKNMTAISIDKKFHSIRFYKDYIIYGSNEHKLTNKVDYQKNYEKSQRDFYKYFKIKQEYSWMNQDIVSNDYLPIIGKIKENLYLATAYNAWGMTNGTIAAKIIYDLIVNKQSKYESLFDPNRNNKNLIINSILRSFNYLKAYTQTIFVTHNPYYIKIKGIKYGIFKDKENKIHTIKLICPHMKCSLIFNKEENTWDCPCHGSRFNLDGILLEGPATNNLEDRSLRK